MMSVPVMSDGIRSGVNWMRLNLRSSTCASVRIRSVLARPGTPTIRLLPPTKSDSRIRSTVASWPMISFLSSAMICPRAAFILSARAMSSAESSFTMSCVTVVTSVPFTSVSQSVNDVVHPELERLVRVFDGAVARVRVLPEFRKVGVVVGNRDQALLRVVVFIEPAENRLAVVLEVLRNDVEVVDVVERVEDRMLGRHLVPDRARKHAVHLRLEVVPGLTHEVVEDEKSALRDVGLQPGKFRLRHLPKPGLGHVGDWILEEFRIVERQHVAGFG